MWTGAFGQANNARNVMAVILIVILAAACAGEPNARYLGTVTTTQGDCGLGFDANGTARATLMVRGTEVQFVPSDGVTVLPGHMDAGGHVAAGSSAVGADKKPFTQVFEGDRKGEAVQGVFATPRCRAAVALRRG